MRCKALEGLEPPGQVAGIDQAGEVLTPLIVDVVEAVMNGGLVAALPSRT
jgi:hypothetical protein